MNYPGYSQYVYSGPVKEFDKIISNNWSSSTIAPSEKKARCNLAYQFKKQYNRAPTAKISLPGEIKRIG